MKINDIKSLHHESNMYKMASEGQRYYRAKNDIMKRKHYIYTERGLIVDPYKANNRIPSAYLSMLVDQKIDYLLGKQPECGIEDEEFFQDLTEIAKKASAEGQQWVQLYIQDGALEMYQVPTCELYPVFNNGELETMFRFYTKDGAEYCHEYTNEEEILYVDEIEVMRKPHLVRITKEGAIENQQGISWGKIPFVQLKNNYDCVYDLSKIRPFIDNYDKILSDFANNLEDFQDVTWILKGYEGQNPSEFINQVKMYKSIPVGEGGDARAETIQIPTEARMAMLDQLEALIFKFGAGINLEKLSGGSLTNVAIKAHFATLDMKANSFSQQVKKFISDYIYFYNIYASMTGSQLLEERDVTFNKSMIINEAEMLEANAKQAGFISEQTRLVNHPWIDDADEEMERMQGVMTIEGAEDGQEE